MRWTARTPTLCLNGRRLSGLLIALNCLMLAQGWRELAPLRAQEAPIQLTPSIADDAGAASTLRPTTAAQTPRSAEELSKIAPPLPIPPAAAAAESASTATPPADDDPLLTLQQQVAARQQQLQNDTERTPESKEQLTKLYEQLRLDLESAIKLRSRRLEMTAAIASASSILEKAKARKAEADAAKPNVVAEALSDLSYEELDQRRLELEAELATAAGERTALTDSLAKRDKRRKELPQLISDTKSKLDSLGSDPPANTANQDPGLQEASRWSFETNRRLLSEQQQSYETEQRLYETESPLLPLQLELAHGAEKSLQDRLKSVNEQLDKIRTNRILNTAREVRALMTQASDSVRPVGQQLLDQTDTWIELASKQAAVKKELAQAQALLDRWSERRANMDARIEAKPGPKGVSTVVTGFNSWVGLMLRKQRGELPDPQQLRSKLRNYQNEMQWTESILFDIEDELQSIQVRKEALEAERTAAADSLSIFDEPSSNQAAVGASGDLLRVSTQALQGMRLDVNAYQDDLYALADIRDNSIRLTNDYRDFIDRHVLWIRSMESFTMVDANSAAEAVYWLVSPGNWREVGLLLGRDVLANPVWTALFLLLLLVLIANQSLLRRRLAELSAKAEKNNCTNYTLTLRSLVLTMLISAPTALILLYFHWRLSVAVGSQDVTSVGTDFPVALANSLRLMATVFFPLELSRQLCRASGLGRKHFGWHEAILARLRVNLRTLISLCIPLIGIVGLFLNHTAQRWEASLGRGAFIALMPALSFFLARILAPRTGIVSGFLTRNPGGWIDRLSWLWYPGISVLPLALAVVSFVGYHYTAQRIAFHIVSTQWTLVLLSIGYFMLTRWLVLNRRRLMLAQARQRLEEAAKRDPANELPVPTEEFRVDLVAINEQTKRLVTSLVITLGFVMFFVIWSDVLPAVTMLEGVRLWPLQAPATDDTFTVTLASALLVIPIVVLVIIAGRNVPGLLEIAFLQHLPLTNAARYAITTLSTYAIYTLGIFIVASVFQIRWQSIQWLVAALGVGLGFGLQEIFANFVSGLILLFEQPIRVGDVISIDGTTGSVSRSRMRATTIVNWDRQELIVPNKDLITGKLLNWTLSDSTNRITFNVGVAYGSDTQRACELILKVLQEHSNVRQDPPPSVTFEAFGDSTLNLALRAFLSSLEVRLVTIHELHQRIYLALNEAGIEIAFPQRDLHIRSLPETWNRWLNRSSQRDSTS